MRLSKTIDQLQEVFDEYGDLYVGVWEGDTTIADALVVGHYTHDSSFTPHYEDGELEVNMVEISS